MSNELTALKSELRERTDLLFSYALQAKVLEAQLAEVKEQLAAAQAEITRLRAGGCARKRGSSKYCRERQELIDKLTTLAAGWSYGYCVMGGDATLKRCADRLREAISGEDEG